MNYALDPVAAECPACHAERAERLYCVDAAQAAQHYVLRETAPDRHRALRTHIVELWGGETCDVLRCCACGFGFAHPFRAGDARFYELAYERTGYPADKWEYRRTLEAIDRADLPDDFSLLEVGAGDGAFLSRVTPARTSPGCVLATEFSDYGRRAIEALGVACLAEDVRAIPADVAGAPFDVICMFQVLEHLDRIDDLFEHLGRLSAQDGHVFIAVPNAARIAFNEANGSLLDLPPNHVGRWTRAAFDALSERHGWHVATREIEPEGARAKVQEMVMYRYMRRRQTSGSAANRVERLQSAPLRRAFQVGVAASYGLAAVPTIARMVWHDGLGASQWVHLRRGTAPG